MDNLSEYFYEMRMFRASMVDNVKKFESDMKGLEVFKGSSFHEKKAREARQEFEQRTIRAKERAQRELVAVLDKMREGIKKKIIQSPTSDMVNTLALLGTAENLSLDEARLYAEAFKDCPLALKSLAQIAYRHSIHVDASWADRQLSRVDALDNAAVTYITMYNGQDSSLITSPTVQMIDRALHDEEFYQGFLDCPDSKTAEGLFLEQVTGSRDHEGFEQEDGSQAPGVELHFDNMDDLLGYIEDVTAGSTPTVKTTIQEEILRNCPESYGAAYRHYKATGEKIDLNGEEGTEQG